MGLLATFVYLPVFFKLQVANIYEYLEKRFDKKIKLFALILYLLCEIFMFPIMAYTPSLSFATGKVISIDKLTMQRIFQLVDLTQVCVLSSCVLFAFSTLQ